MDIWIVIEAICVGKIDQVIGINIVGDTNGVIGVLVMMKQMLLVEILLEFIWIKYLNMINNVISNQFLILDF